MALWLLDNNGECCEDCEQMEADCTCATPTCYSCGNCCFSDLSTITVTWTGGDGGGGYPFCDGLPGDGNKTLTFYTSDAEYYKWRLVEGNFDYFVFYRCVQNTWYFVVNNNEPFPDGMLEILSGNSNSQTCCGGSGLLNSTTCNHNTAATFEITVNNNKCCKCSGGDCSVTSDGTASECDGGGINTCTATQDEDCIPP